jgi:hypothetical protein
MAKLSEAQRRTLEFYARHGRTTQAHGTITTWRCLVRRGLLARSHGLGVIETEITDAGLAALSPLEASVSTPSQMGGN